MLNIKQYTSLKGLELIEVKLNKNLRKNKEDLLLALDYIELNNVYINERVLELIPQAIYEMICAEVIDNRLIKEYELNNAKKKKYTNDYRTSEQTKYTHFIGFCYECIVQAIMEHLGYIVTRNGCDLNPLDANYVVNNKPDLIIVNPKTNKRVSVDVQKSTYFIKEKEVAVKESKLSNLLKYDDIYMLWIDNNSNGIYFKFEHFVCIDEAIYKYDKYLEKGIGGKPSFVYKVKEKELRKVI